MCFILDDILSPGQVGRDGVALLVALMDLPVCARDARQGREIFLTCSMRSVQLQRAQVFLAVTGTLTN